MLFHLASYYSHFAAACGSTPVEPIVLDAQLGIRLLPDSNRLIAGDKTYFFAKNCTGQYNDANNLCIREFSSATIPRPSPQQPLIVTLTKAERIPDIADVYTVTVQVGSTGLGQEHVLMHMIDIFRCGAEAATGGTLPLGTR